jgi:hypothetical protein
MRGARGTTAARLEAATGGALQRAPGGAGAGLAALPEDEPWTGWVGAPPVTDSGAEIARLSWGDVAHAAAPFAQSAVSHLPPEVQHMAAPAMQAAGLVPATHDAHAAGGGGAGAGGAAHAGASHEPPPNIDEIYEGVLDRLRRDLMSERERMGDLLGNIGHHH